MLRKEYRSQADQTLELPHFSTALKSNQIQQLLAKRRNQPKRYRYHTTTEWIMFFFHHMLKYYCDEWQYRISSANFKARPRKLNMLARQIAGLPIDEAIKQMEFSKKKAAKRILSNLVLARRNAELQKGMKNLVICMWITTKWIGTEFTHYHYH